MGLPPRSSYALDEVAQAWGATVRELLGFAVDGKLTISVLLFGLRVDAWHRVESGFTPLVRRHADGPHAVFEQDLWALNSRGSVRLRRFRSQDGYLEVLETHPGVEVTAAELVITAEERSRFEQEHAIASGGADNCIGAFGANPDYSEVSLGRHTYQLSPKRRAVVQLLHEAWEAGSPWMRDQVLLAHAGSECSRMVDLFGPLAGWRDLLRCDRKGNWRLNIPDRQSTPGKQRTFRRPNLYLVR